jgi:hypothetical protein
MGGSWEAPFAARAAVAGAAAALWLTLLGLLGALDLGLAALVLPLALAGEVAFEALWRRQPEDDGF